jgi:hypothetical protein
LDLMWTFDDLDCVLLPSCHWNHSILSQIRRQPSCKTNYQQTVVEVCEIKLY